MSFTLSKFGFKLPEREDNSEKIINYILDTLNGNPIKVYSQFINLEILKTSYLENIKQEITKNFIEKRNRIVIKTLNELDKFILEELKLINKIEITLGLQVKNSKYYFGNGILTNHYIDVINNLLLTKYKYLFEEYFDKNLERYENEESIFQTLKYFESYHHIIFDEFKIYLSDKVSKMDYLENSELPSYLNLINKFNYFYKISQNLKKIIIKNFPKNNYNSCYLDLVENQLKIVERILSLTNLSFLEIYFSRIFKTVNLVYNEKNNYYSAFLGKILNQFFNTQIEHFNYKTFKKLINLSNLPDNTGILQSCILTFVAKISKSKEFIENLVNYFLDNPKEVEVIIYLWFNNLNQKEYFLIYLQNKLMERIWNLNQLKVNSYLKFLNNLKTYPQAQKIISMLNDLKKSEEYSSMISPQKLYLFSQGIWDYAFNDEHFDVATQSLDHPFSMEFYQINSKIQKPFSTLNLYLLKGNIKLEYQDEKKKLSVICLPAQAFILKYLENNNYTKEDLQSGILKNLSFENLEQILDTLIQSQLVYLNNLHYCLIEDLSLLETSEINLAERFFITSKLEEKISETSKIQTQLSFNEVCPCVINHLLKINPLTLKDILRQVNLKLATFYEFSEKDLEEQLELMIKKDLICLKDDIYEKLLY
jgi:hypothetical protein